MFEHHPPSSHHGAVEAAIDWLSSLHRKGWKNAITSVMNEVLSEEEWQRLADFDEQTVQSLEINVMDWLLAEGDIQARGGVRRVNDYLLSPAGPRLNPGQRDWLLQLGQRPLRLYDVTDVVQGQQMTLCDALDKEAEPVVVRERMGTQNLTPGALMASRVMRVGDHFEMSGSAYLFTQLRHEQVLSVMREQQEALGHALEAPRKMGLTIMRQWLEQFLKPTPLPTLVDHYTGEPMVMITDHYRVEDEAALAQTMAAQADIEGDRQNGWSRIFECSDGQTRASVHINPGKKPDQLELFYRTQRYADEGRVWFEALAGASVTFVKRKVQDPTSVMAKGQQAGSAPSKGKRKTPAQPQIDPTTMSDLMANAIRGYYANWADEPIPALNHQTPREAIKTSAGLERVKGLLRSYEAGEAQQAAEQKRSPVSYDFLWQALGLVRS